MKLGEAMYKAQQADASDAGASEAPKDDVIDAEFKDVGDDK
jgi:molecular chaperone DnaK